MYSNALQAQRYILSIIGVMHFPCTGCRQVQHSDKALVYFVISPATKGMVFRSTCTARPSHVVPAAAMCCRVVSYKLDIKSQLFIYCRLQLLPRLMSLPQQQQQLQTSRHKTSSQQQLQQQLQGLCGLPALLEVPLPRSQHHIQGRAGDIPLVKGCCPQGRASLVQPLQLLPQHQLLLKKKMAWEVLKQCSASTGGSRLRHKTRGLQGGIQASRAGLIPTALL